MLVICELAFRLLDIWLGMRQVVCICLVDPYFASSVAPKGVLATSWS